MILFGCAIAFVIAFAPRVVLLLAWFFSDLWPRVWNGDFLIPLLGIIFVPYTTVMYMLIWKPTGINGWDWMWIILGLVLDATKWANIAANRRNVPGYSESMP